MKFPKNICCKLWFRPLEPKICKTEEHVNVKRCISWILLFQVSSEIYLLLLLLLLSLESIISDNSPSNLKILVPIISWNFQNIPNFLHLDCYGQLTKNIGNKKNANFQKILKSDLFCVSDFWTIFLILMVPKYQYEHFPTLNGKASN